MDDQEGPWPRLAQSQACEQSMVEAEKDCKKMIGHMSEPHETMEVSFALVSVLKAFPLRIDQEYSTGRVYLRHQRIIAVHLNDVALGRDNMYKLDK
nr:ribonuclease H-like domain-containing protein [Tanacetum cinerariifolium]